MDSIVRIASVTGVDVELRIAGPGGRSYAFIVDWHIRFLAAAAWYFAATFAYGGLAAFQTTTQGDAGYFFFVSLPALAIYFLYHPILEIALRGQTPGKRIAAVRVVALAHGGAPGAGAILIRNVFRLVDALPILYAFGLLTTMLTKHAVRIGDIAAGTVLVYDDAPGGELLDRLGGRGVERLGLARAQLARELLDRWPALAPAARAKLAAELLEKAGVSVDREAPGDEALRVKLLELVA